MGIIENKLNEEDLKKVNGGYIYLNPETNVWYVIDVNTGKAVSSFEKKEDAEKLNKKNCWEMGMGEIDGAHLEWLRNHYGLTKEEQFGEF